MNLGALLLAVVLAEPSANVSPRILDHEGLVVGAPIKARVYADRVHSYTKQVLKNDDEQIHVAYLRELDLAVHIRLKDRGFNTCLELLVDKEADGTLDLAFETCYWKLTALPQLYFLRNRLEKDIASDCQNGDCKTVAINALHETLKNNAKSMPVTSAHQAAYEEHLRLLHDQILSVTETEEEEKEKRP